MRLVARVWPRTGSTPIIRTPSVGCGFDMGSSGSPRRIWSCHITERFATLPAMRAPMANRCAARASFTALGEGFEKPSSSNPCRRQSAPSMARARHRCSATDLVCQRLGHEYLADRASPGRPYGREECRCTTPYVGDPVLATTPRRAPSGRNAIYRDGARSRRSDDRLCRWQPSNGGYYQPLRFAPRL